jgi:hypothetical protein
MHAMEVPRGGWSSQGVATARDGALRLVDANGAYGWHLRKQGRYEGMDYDEA